MVLVGMQKPSEVEGLKIRLIMLGKQKEKKNPKPLWAIKQEQTFLVWKTNEKLKNGNLDEGIQSDVRMK